MKAMLSSKLKITVCVTVLALLAFAGASGVVYRSVAQETKQAASPRSAVGPAATDDQVALRLEIKALRLEIEALRKSLQAPHEALRKSLQVPRDRVKAPENKEQLHRENQKIVVTSPQTKDVTITQQYVCQIHSHRHINVRALANGYVQEIFVKEGQAVKQGDVMFKILPTLYKAKHDAELAEVRVAEIELNHTKKLSEQKAVSSEEVALHQAKLDKARAQAKLAEAELNFTIVKAPFDGMVDRLHEREGSLVNQQDTLTTLSDNRVVWVYFNVPEASYLEYMAREGQDQEAPRVELRLANGSKFSKTGRIGAIEANFNNQTGTIPFRADFENLNGLLRHGQSGTVLLQRTLKNARIIPQRATFEVVGKRYVYVVDKKSVVHQREIVIQNESEGIFVIEKGLNVNDQIVLEGVRQVRDGEKVEYEFRKPK
jgi:membrane fusion protein (multidrug efflux system)